MKKKIAGAVAALAGAELTGAVYLYRQMTGCAGGKKNLLRELEEEDLVSSAAQREEDREWLLAQTHEDVFLISEDNLKLHATWYPGEGEGKAVIGFHGFTGRGTTDMAGIARYYLQNGFQVLLTDARGHGKSEGGRTGYGEQNREDAALWAQWLVKKTKGNSRIILHGLSMGAATALMAAGKRLPLQVKGAVADSAYTSARDVFAHVLKERWHIPAFPVLQMVDSFHRRDTGWGLDDCSAARAVRRARIPALLIHGGRDRFIPEEMCEEIYESYVGKVEKWIVPGAGHMEAFYRDREGYEARLENFLEECMEAR